MIQPQSALTLLSPDGELHPKAQAAVQSLDFEDLPTALLRFKSLCQSQSQRETCSQIIPALFFALSEAATPDGSLLNFQRFVESVPDRQQLFVTLAQRPRAVEILVKLFVGSQFLTEILLRHPHYLSRLTEHKRLAEFKTRADFLEQARLEIGEETTLAEAFTQLSEFRQWEMLRLAACDTFGLMDLKTITRQLSHLADTIVQLSLERTAQESKLDPNDIVILALGKLGGEELNYSSDIDLIFLCEQHAERYWGLGQSLIKVLSNANDSGFLYRVDMRLRPWGHAGPLVSTIDAYVDYLQHNGSLWEKQALLKARPIAGNRRLGDLLLSRLDPIIFDVDPAAARKNAWEMKQKIEQHLARKGNRWGEVKAGPGGIRDIEFLTQYLQLIHGRELPQVRSRNSLDGLVRLADHELLYADEYRRLSEGYVSLRTIEHDLQLMHNRQEHLLPSSPRGLAYLARRLDFADAEGFLRQFELHTRSVREIFERYLSSDQGHAAKSATEPGTVASSNGHPSAPYRDCFPTEDIRQHQHMLSDLNPTQAVRVCSHPHGAGGEVVTIAGSERSGELSAICGLLFASGFDIESGHVFTGGELLTNSSPNDVPQPPRQSICVFHVLQTPPGATNRNGLDFWMNFERELNELLLAESSGPRTLQGRLANRVASAFEGTRPTTAPLPIEIDIDDSTPSDATILQIGGDDTPGFLYELTNAIAISGLSITRMDVQSIGRRVIDTLHVVDENGHKLATGERLNALRAAIVLIKHFTHLLPQSPNPESALIHFQEFVQNLIRKPDWLEQLSPLHDSEVLGALARLLGISDFLWDDFLRLQHENLFPVVTNVQELQQPRDRSSLRRELTETLAATNKEERLSALNAFKDREMMRVDMRHILGLQEKFGMFARELTNVAEVVVGAAVKHCESALQSTHGVPTSSDGTPARLSVCGLGKFGGREMGYASDVELMFIFDKDGQTTGPDVITNLEYFQRLVTAFQQTIRSKRHGIFEIDLRLRPYGKAGSLAVSLDSFEAYFAPAGPAWPYERQALVKLRPIAGDQSLGRQIVQTRDGLIYRGERFDVTAMRAMREKQVRQLVQAGTFNAKLSPGALVDCEYLVQGLQMTYGHLDKSIREPNTREAMKALEAHQILTGQTRIRLRDAYRFFRRLIDALRMVRGNARDLTVPEVDSDEFRYLARRLGDRASVERLREKLQQHTRNVMELTSSFEELLSLQGTLGA